MGPSACIPRSTQPNPSEPTIAPHSLARFEPSSTLLCLSGADGCAGPRFEWTARSEPSASAVVGENVGVPSADYAEYRTWTGELTLNDVALGIELDGAAAPQAVSAFLSDVDTGYYVDKTCHRLATSEGFELLQCGSIDGLGSSDPDFSYGPIENAPADDFYPAGTIAMARVSGDEYSNGHQFFLVYGDSTIPSDEVGGYTVLGTITSGLDDLIDQITSAGIDPDLLGTDGTGGPLVTTTITQITLQ